MELDIQKILESLVDDKNLVKYHEGWGYYIEVPFDSIKKIGLIQKGENLELSLFYGNTQSQSRAFYSKKRDISYLADSGWSLSPDFHFEDTFGRNILWLSVVASNEEYLNFWNKNTQLLHQHGIEQIPNLIDLLEEQRIIKVDSQLKEEVYNNSFLNVCPGFACIYSLKIDEAKSLFELDLLNQRLIDKINDGLKLIGEKFYDFNDNSDFLFEEDGDPDGL